jgi:putative transposase
LYLAGPRCEHIAHSRAAESEKVKIDRTQLEEENRRLKQLVADLSLDKLMLQDMLQKKCERRRELVRHLEWTYRVSERRGCAVLRFNRSSHRYRANRNDQAMLRGRIRGLAAGALRLLPHLDPAPT